MNIVVRKDRGQWIAYIRDNALLWDYGRSIGEAIGNLIWRLYRKEYVAKGLVVIEEELPR